jgi:hypothetical protein
MLDWHARIDDLHQFLAAEYQVHDREAIQVLLAALINCPDTPLLRVVLETGWAARYCEQTWFAFGGLWDPVSLTNLLAQRPSRLDRMIRDEYLAEPGSTRLFIESQPERIPRYGSNGRSREGAYLLSQCLRLRTPTPLTPANLIISHSDAMRRSGKLRALTLAVIEDRTGARPQQPPAFTQPPQFLSQVSLVHKLAPWYSDWSALLNAFACLAVRHAYLHGRAETAVEDYRVLARVARDCMPPWIAQALLCLCAGASASCKYATLVSAMHLPAEPHAADRHPERTPQGELHRLREHGLLEWASKEMTWSLAPQFAPQVASLLAGHAFENDAAAARR